MRGAVAFALALHMDVQNIENKQMMLTSTLFVVLFTIIFMGGTALPLIKVLDGLFPDVEEANEKHDHTRKGLRHADETHSTTRSRKIVLSKTQEMNIMDHAEYIADHYETNDTLHHHFKTQSHHVRKNFFTRLNEQIVRPLLIRSISKEVSLLDLEIILIFNFRKFKKTNYDSDKWQKHLELTFWMI